MSHSTETPVPGVASHDEIHRSVRERYASIARSGQTGCCETLIGLVESATGVEPTAPDSEATATTQVSAAVPATAASGHDPESDCCGPGCCPVEGSASSEEKPSAQRLADVLETVEAAACCDDACCSPESAANDGGSTGQDEEATPNILGLGCGDPLLGADVQPGEVVVDLGSGAGGDALRVAERCGPSGEVIGVDMTQEMVARARANANRSGVSNVRFVEGYIESLPLESESTDWVISNCVINLAPDKAPVFAEIARVLKPGARMSVADIVRPAGAKTSMPAPGKRWASCIDGAIAVDAYREGLEAAGLVDIEIEAIGAVHKAIEQTQSGLPFSARIKARKPA